MTQLTIRSQSKLLDARLKQIANERGWSLNQAANYLLHKGAGLLDTPTQSGIGDQMDDFIGTWSEAESSAFDLRIAEAFESTDHDLWR